MTTVLLSLLLSAGSCPAPSSFPDAGACTYRMQNSDAGWDPDPVCTPGDFDPTLTVEALCAEGQSRRCKPDAAVKRKILAAYSTMRAGEIDHLIPLCAGGLNTAKNLWPQPSPDFRRKDVVEAAACRGICSGRLSLEAARDLVLHWRESYARLTGASR